MIQAFESDIDLGLPLTPLTPDPKLRDELQLVYSALQILQRAISDSNKAQLAQKQRIDALVVRIQALEAAVFPTAPPINE